jgi:hypothetical protein
MYVNRAVLNKSTFSFANMFILVLSFLDILACTPKLCCIPNHRIQITIELAIIDKPPKQSIQIKGKGAYSHSKHELISRWSSSRNDFFQEPLFAFLKHFHHSFKNNAQFKGLPPFYVTPFSGTLQNFTFHRMIPRISNVFGL